MALVKRKLRVTITLATISGQAQTFDNSGGADSVIIENLRMTASVMYAGATSMGTLDLTIYGLSLSTINKLSTMGLRLNQLPKNKIVLEAGEDPDGSGAFQNGSTVYTGYTLSALADFNASPETAFHISAQTMAPQSVETATASSFPGSAEIATIMSGIATKLSLKFENSGVTGSLSNVYLSGSYKDQAQQCVSDAGINWNAGEGGVLAIWPKFGSRGGQVPVISPQTGMVGYPTWSALGIDVRTLYNGSVGFGGKVHVDTSVSKASGDYTVYGLAHELDCEMPDGRWFSIVNCYNPVLNNATS